MKDFIVSYQQVNTVEIHVKALDDDQAYEEAQKLITQWSESSFSCVSDNADFYNDGAWEYSNIKEH